MNPVGSKAIASLLHDYFDGLYFCDIDRLAAVFHPKAIYATADETPFLHRTMEQYFPVVAAREPASARGEPKHYAIDEIQFAGENTAVARFRCSIGPREFVDLLTLVQVDGDWRIIAKVFHFTDRPS